LPRAKDRRYITGRLRPAAMRCCRERSAIRTTRREEFAMAETSGCQQTLGNTMVDFWLDDDGIWVQEMDSAGNIVKVMLTPFGEFKNANGKWKKEKRKLRPHGGDVIVVEK
jgi:hypothetical protein